MKTRRNVGGERDAGPSKRVSVRLASIHLESIRDIIERIERVKTPSEAVRWLLAQYREQNP